MERLFHIKYYASDGKFIARVDYSGLQFANETLAEKFIQSEKRQMETAMECRLKLNPFHKEIPTFTVKELITAYCEVANFNYSDIVGKGRMRDKVNLRMFITKTALDLGFVHGQLRPFFPDGTSYHYEKTLNDLIETSDVTFKIWKGYEENVMVKLGKIYDDDGSGQKAKS